MGTFRKFALSDDWAMELQDDKDWKKSRKVRRNQAQNIPRHFTFQICRRY
jgi:hypothetical protein